MARLRQLYLLTGGADVITLPTQETPFRLVAVTGTIDIGNGGTDDYLVTLLALEGGVATSLRINLGLLANGDTGGFFFGEGMDSTSLTTNTASRQFTAPLPPTVFPPNTTVTLALTSGTLDPANIIGVPVFIIERFA